MTINNWDAKGAHPETPAPQPKPAPEPTKDEEALIEFKEHTDEVTYTGS